MIHGLRSWFGVFFISLVLLFSCDIDTDSMSDADANASFDASFKSVLDIMDANPSEALEQLNELELNAENINSRYYMAKAKWYKGYIYDEILEEVSLAYQNYNEALKDALQTDDASLKMKIYNNLGILYRFYGQYDAAINCYESAIALDRNLTTEQLSDLYHNFGVALKLKGDSLSFYQAERAFTKALKLAEQIEYHENIAMVHNQIGLMYKAIGDYDMARMAYNNTIRTYIDHPDLQEMVGKAYHGIGVTYMDEMKVSEAVTAFEKAIEYKHSSGSIFVTKYDLGTVLLRDGQIDEAINVWENALQEKHNKNSVEQVKIYSDLTTALKMRNRFAEALEYSEIYNASIENILKEDEKYMSESDRVLFANVVKDYAEFNKPEPFFSRAQVIIPLFLIMILLALLAIHLYFKSGRKATKVITKIQSQFLEIKVD